MNSWIKVTDRMPEDCTQVLVTEKRLKTRELFTSTGFYTGRQWLVDGMIGIVISWMPLPEPDTDEGTEV